MSSSEWKQNNFLYITDEEENCYDLLNLAIGGKNDLVSIKFGVTKSVFENLKLYLNYIDISGKLQTVEIINKN